MAAETPDTALRELLRLEIQRRHRRRARRDDVIDEPLLACQRLLVAEAVAEAQDWAGYRAALVRCELDITPGGGGLILVDHPSGRALAKGSLVGPGCLRLVRGFGAALPGHPHRAQAQNVLRTARHCPDPAENGDPERIDPCCAPAQTGTNASFAGS